MPVDLLQQISRGPLPRTLENMGDIDRLRVLVAAGMVEAILPDVHSPVQRAEILRISRLGEEALRRPAPAHLLQFAVRRQGARAHVGTPHNGPLQHLDS